MTVDSAPAGPPPRRPWAPVVDWVRRKDPRLAAIKRSVRAAVVMPLAFAVAHQAFTDGQVGLFASFGSFALMLFVDFRGRPPARLRAYAVLVAVGAVLITLGTVASTHEAAAVVGMAVVGFVLLFAGIASPAAAAATTAALLTFVLPVAVAQPTSAIGPRLLGWAIAAAFAIPTCLLVWPAAWHDDLRRRIASALSAVADLALVRAEGGHDPAAEAAMTAEVTGLRAQFQATPYPPLAATGTAVALSKLVGRVEWVADNTALTGDPAATPDPGPVREVVAGVAATLRHCSALVCDASGHPVDDPTLVDTVRASTERLDGLIAAELACELSVLVDPEAEPEGTPDGGGDRPRLDPSFRARTMGLTAEMVADSTLEASGAQAVGDRRLGPSATPEPRLVWPRLDLPPLLPLGVVPEQPPGGGRPGRRGGGGGGHRRGARILGGAGRPVGAALQRPGDRGHRRPGHRRHHPRVRHRRPDHDRGRRPHHALVVHPPRRRPGGRGRPVHDLLHRRPGRLHRHGGGAVQHHRARGAGRWG